MYESTSERKTFTGVTSLDSRDITHVLGKQGLLFLNYEIKNSTRNTVISTINVGILTELPHLAELYLHNCNVMQVTFPDLQIRRLHLDNVYFDTDSFASLSNLTQLQELQLGMVHTNTTYELDESESSVSSSRVPERIPDKFSGGVPDKFSGGVPEGTYVCFSTFPSNNMLLMFPHLTMLDLSSWIQTDDSTLKFLSNLSHLSSLDLSGRTDITCYDSLSKLHNLTSLILIKALTHEEKIMRDETLLTLNNVTQLKKLDLSSCAITTVTPLSSLVKLHTLILNDCSYLRNSTLKIMYKFSELSHLSIDNSNIHPDNLVKPLMYDTQLTFLSLRGMNLNDTHLTFISNLPSLTSLDISCVKSNYTKLGLFTLKTLTNLKRLSLDGNANIRNSDIAKLTSLKKLTRLSVSGCVSLDISTLYLQVRTVLPNLEFIMYAS
jgi:Leucine-rich repeat (LRR) protein